MSAAMDQAPQAVATIADLERQIARERDSRQAAEAELRRRHADLAQVADAAREAERRLQMALWASGEGIWEWDVAGDRVTVDSVSAEGQLRRVGPRRMADMMEMVHPSDRESLRLVMGLYLRQASPDIDTAYRTLLKGQTHWHRLRGRALQRGADGRPLRVIGTLKDVTAQRAAEQSLHMMAQAFSSTHDALVVIDAADAIVQANERFAALLERPLDDLEGRSLSSLLQLDAPLSMRGAARGEVDLMGSGNTMRHIEYVVTPVSSDGDSATTQCSIVTLHDVSERRRAQDALQRQAYIDGLTGLSNRASVMRLLDARCSNPGAARFALLFLDLDGFKGINDTLGHRAGDALLCEVARLLRVLAGRATIGRLGGDEFVIVLDPGSDAAAAESLARAILAQATQPVVVEGHSVVVTPSIGIACFPADGLNPEDLLLDADIAMYAAKEQGRNRYVVFHGDLDRGRQRRQHLQQLLRADSDRDAFTFVVQSQFDAAAKLVGGEMLIRWRTAAFGPVSPAEFIPLAEQIGVIDRIGRQALRTAAQVASILKFMRSNVTLAVNLSPRQLLLDDVERMLMDACNAADVEPDRLVLELTETALVTDAEKVGGLLRRLSQQGFGLALDDFGTGYSSLSHLRRLPFDKVKIDRSFVQDLDTDPRSAVMMEGIVHLCDSLGLAIVAEGIETRSQFERLRQMGVQHYQGFWFARPQPMAAWVDSVAPRARKAWAENTGFDASI